MKDNFEEVGIDAASTKTSAEGESSPLRLCGSCHLCCKTHGVKELEKPVGSWCKLVEFGKGCTDYQNRPESCRRFACLWLQGIGIVPEEFRPDRIGAVLSVNDNSDALIVFIDPGNTRKWMNNKAFKEYIESIQKKMPVIFINPKTEARKVVGPADKVNEMMERDGNVKDFFKGGKHRIL